jgi:Ankyrin repeat
MNAAPTSPASTQVQSDLETAIFEGNLDAIKAQLDAGGDPFSFPEHALAKSHPKHLSVSLLGASRAHGCKPGELSLMALLVLDNPAVSVTCVPMALKTVRQPFDEPPLVGRGKDPIDLLDLMRSQAIFTSWSTNMMPGAAIRVYCDLLDAMNLDAPLVKRGFSELAASALNCASDELNRINAKATHTHETLGFRVFAALVLKGVEPPVEALSKRNVEFGSYMPLLSIAVYHGQSDPPPPERDELIRRLIKLGAPVNAGSTGTGLTPLMAAANRSDVRAMRILIDGGADLFAKDSRNWVARSYAKSNVKTNKKRGAEALAFCDAAIAHARITSAMGPCATAAQPRM